MRIGIITCSCVDNYGARLQCYALSKFLLNLGHDVFVIDYRPSNMRFSQRLWYKPKLSIESVAKLFLRYNFRRNDILRHKIYEDFSNEYLPLTSQIYCDFSSLQRNPPEADVYIAGSDQIWNTEFKVGRDGAFYLNFGDKNVRRISYAASFGTSELVEDYVDFVREHLKIFDAISVRESSGLDILKSMGYKGLQVVDPVFLLSKEEWNGIILNEKPKEKYLLVYDQMGCDRIKKEARKLAKEKGLKIYSIGQRNLTYADKNFLVSSPQEFLWLIKNTELMVSNSFHGMAFAYIFHKCHIFVERADGHNQRMYDFKDLIRNNDLTEIIERSVKFLQDNLI